MAKQVSNVFIRLGIENFEGIEKLKSAFRELDKSVGPTSQSIDAAIAAVRNYATASTQSEQIIRGQIEAFKGLRSQVDVSGTRYTELSNEINRLQATLRGSSDAVENQRQALLRNAAAGNQSAKALENQINGLERLRQQTRPGSSAFLQLTNDIEKATIALGRFKTEASQAANVVTQRPASTFEKIANQVAILQRRLQTLNITSAEFLKYQQRINLVTTVQSTLSGRQQVRAAAAMYASPQYSGFVQDAAAKLELPDTTAALNLQLSELSDQLANTSRGSANYTDIAIRMAEIQRRLRTDVIGTSEAFNKLEAAQAGSARRAEKLAGIQEYYGGAGTRDPLTGAIITGGAPTATSGRLRPGTQYAQPIGPQPYPQAARTAEAQVQQAYDNMLNIQRRAGMERVELQTKQNQLYIDKLLEGLDLEGQARKRQFDVDLADFDRRMGIMERRRGRRLGGRQLAQIGGAAISGGIFGGPEGFLGGVIGGAVGGVGGSFAGAAAGAQIGMMRQQLGVAAKYTAELNLVKTTLAQAVSNQEEYNQALAASRSISKDYTVDLMGTIQGYAQLITATRANNISLADTEKIYRGIIASGVAFGKSQEDIASMVRATVQILSKGKVTAEELRGQLGERLPGAVPKFAEATGRTMAQLEKDLEDGKVSIDDFKKFAIKGFIDYDEAAKKIGAGPEKAGLRLDNALKQMMESYGTFFQTVGAGFQNNLTVVINWANENEKVMKRIMYLIIKVSEFQYKYLNPLTAPVLGLSELPGNVERGARSIGQANPTTSNLFGNLLRTNPITGPQVLYSDLLNKGKVTVRTAPNTENTKRLTSIFEAMTADYESLFPKAKVPTIFGQGAKGLAPSGAPSTDEDAKKRKKAAQEALDTLRDVLAVEEAVFKAGQALQLSRYELNKKLTDMETQNRLAALGTIERETAQALEDRRAKTMQFAEELRALEDKQLEAARALTAAQRLAAKGGDQQAVGEAQATLNLVTTQLNDLVKSKSRFMTAADVATMNALTASTKSRNEELQKTIRLETLRADLQQRGYSAAQVQLQLDIASAEDERRRSLTGVTQLDQIAKINAGYAEMVANLQKIYDLNQANANTFGFREGAQRYVESIGTMREATASLTEQGFKGLEDVIVQLTTTGTANFQAFAASILEQTARMIIQQLVLKTIMQALGAIGGGGGGGGLGNYGVNLGMGFNQIPSFPLGSALPSFAGFAGMAKGGVFAANGIVPYAMGGIVTRPTLFPFAKGGAIGTGLMGEAGPEAIIPLQRGANGKLGVAGGAGTTNITINVDASGGTTVSGDEAQAKQLGQVVTAAVQAELIKQKRPGGLFNR